jgi:hypothetical protein
MGPTGQWPLPHQSKLISKHQLDSNQKSKVARSSLLPMQIDGAAKITHGFLFA